MSMYKQENGMAATNPLNVKRFLEQSTAKTTVDDLQKRGIRNVRVLDQRTLQKLIEDSVTKVLAGRAGLLTEEQKKQILADSRRELNRLMQEYNQLKKRQQAAMSDRNSLVRELENLQRQLQVTKQVSEERIRQAEARAARADPELEKKLQESMSRLESAQEQNRHLEARVRELEEKLRTIEGGRSKELQEAFDRGVRSQEEYIRELKERLSGAEKEAAELRSRQAGESALAARLDELAKRDDAVAERLARLFNQTVESLNRRIGSLKLRGGVEEEVEYRASGKVLENLLKEEIESNLGTISSEQKVSSEGMDDRLTKLKNLQAKFQKPKDEGVRKEGGEKKE